MGTVTKSSTITAKWNKYGLETSIEVSRTEKVRESFSISVESLVTAPDGGLPFLNQYETKGSSINYINVTLEDDIGTDNEGFFELWAQGRLEYSAQYGNMQIMYFGSDETPYFIYAASSQSEIKTDTITVTITNDDGTQLTSSVSFRVVPCGYTSIDISSYEKMTYDSSGKENGIVLFTNKEYTTTLETALGISTELIQFFFDNKFLEILEYEFNEYQPNITMQNGRIVATSESACPLMDTDSSDRTVAYDGVTRILRFTWFEYSPYNSTSSHSIFAVNEERVTDTFSGYSASYLYYCYVSNETSSDNKPTVKIWSSATRTSSSSSSFSYSKPSSAPSYCQLGILFRMSATQSQRNLAYACWLGYVYFQPVIQGPGTNLFNTTDAFGTKYSNQAQAYVNSGNYVLPMFFVPSSSLGSSGTTVTLGDNSTQYVLLAITSSFDFASGQPASPYQWGVRLIDQNGSSVTYGTIYMADKTTATWFGP